MKLFLAAVYALFFLFIRTTFVSISILFIAQKKRERKKNCPNSNEYIFLPI